MKNRKSNESRRKLLKSIAAGSGAIIAGKSLPDNWSKPVVDAVMLPAHAQTSLTLTFNYFGQDVSVASIDSGRSFAERVSDTLIEDAHAGGHPPGSSPIIAMSAAVDGSMATVLFTPSLDPVDSWALFQSDLPTDGTAGTIILGPGGDCGAGPWPGPGGRGPQAVRIVGYASGDPTITVEITGGSGGGAVRQYVLPQGPGTATAVGCLPPVI